MPSKTTMALVILLVFGSDSAALADTNNRTGHHGSVARRAVSVIMSNDRTGAVNHAVRPSLPRRALGSPHYSLPSYRVPRSVFVASRAQGWLGSN